MSLIRWHKYMVQLTIEFFHARFGSYSVYGRLSDHGSSSNIPSKSWYRLTSYIICLLSTYCQLYTINSLLINRVFCHPPNQRSIYKNAVSFSLEGKNYDVHIKASVRLVRDSKEILKEPCVVYGNKCLSLIQVYRWVSKSTK